MNVSAGERSPEGIERVFIDPCAEVSGRPMPGKNGWIAPKPSFEEFSVADFGGITDEQEVMDVITEAAAAPVKLSVIAGADRLPIVRSVVERTLFIDDWSVDDVADVKLGVDEICSQLIAAAEPGSSIAVSIAAGPAGVTVQIDGWPDSAFAIDTAGFGWRVVETVTDAQTVAYVETGGGRQVVVRVAKSRTP